MTESREVKVTFVGAERLVKTTLLLSIEVCLLHVGHTSISGVGLHYTQII